MALKYERNGKIAVITLNRPEALNVFNSELLKEFSRSLIDFRDDEDAWVLIITGAGDKAFSAGFDLKEEVPKTFPPMITRGLEIFKPIIAAVNGVALGGGLEVALACDIRIAADNARLGVPEVRWGLIPGWGGTQRLARLIPMSKAVEMVLMARIIDAAEALDVGLVNKVVPSSDLMKTAMEWALEICALGPLAVRTAKKTIVKGSSLPLEEGLRLEEHLFGLLRETKDAKEGPKSFVEKRKPEFKGK
ncbi:enoyl-CoA hydratase/isomerase family protein [Chloroflexota bacterium]